MKLAMEHNDLVSKLVAVDIAPVNYAAFSIFSDYIEYMRRMDLSTIKSRKQADEFLLDLIPVIKAVFFKCLLNKGLGS